MRLGQLQRSLRGGIVGWGILFAVVSVFYAVTFSFRPISDTYLNSYQTRALALHGDIDLSRYGNKVPRHAFTAERGGKRLSVYGVGVSVSALPIYAAGARMGASDRVLQAATSIPFVAAGALILFRLLLRLFPRAVAVGGTVVYAFGTTMWPLAAMAFYQHGPASFFQALGLTGLFSERPRGPALAGFGFAAAGFVRPTLFIPLFLVGVFYLIEGRRQAFLYALASAPAIAGVLIQNRWVWGSWLSGGYSETGVGFQGDVPRALFGLLFGWYRGIFAYSPILAVGVVGAVLALRARKGFLERRMIALAISSIALVFFYARWTAWYGGQNQFGYRLLLDIVPFLVVLTAYAAGRSERLRTIAVPFGVLSVMTMAFGAAPNRSGWDGPLFPKGLVRTSLGQSWLVFVNHPLGSVLRLMGVAGIAAAFYLFSRARDEPDSSLPT